MAWYTHTRGVYHWLDQTLNNSKSILNPTIIAQHGEIHLEDCLSNALQYTVSYDTAQLVIQFVFWYIMT